MGRYIHYSSVPWHSLTLLFLLPEMVLSFNLTLDPSTVVMSVWPFVLSTRTRNKLMRCTNRVWISSSDVTSVVEQGFRVVHAASNYFYLDCGGGGWVGANPLGFVFLSRKPY